MTSGIFDEFILQQPGQYLDVLTQELYIQTIVKFPRCRTVYMFEILNEMVITVVVKLIYRFYFLKGNWRYVDVTRGYCLQFLLRNNVAYILHIFR